MDVGGGLDRLDGADGVALLYPVVGLGELNVDNVAQLVGRVLGDADDARLLLDVDVDPLVVLCVPLLEGCACDGTVSEMLPERGCLVG